MSPASQSFHLKILTILVAAGSIIMAWNMGDFLWTYVRPTFVALAEGRDSPALAQVANWLTLCIGLLPMLPALAALLLAVRGRQDKAFFLACLTLLLVFGSILATQGAILAAIVVPTLVRLQA